jgi:hypothetical protein
MGLGILSIGCNCCGGAGAGGGGVSALFSLGTQCPSGGPVASVSVTLAGDGYSQTQATDALGQCTFTGLTPGATYSISYTIPGFGPPRYAPAPASVVAHPAGFTFASVAGPNTAGGYLCNIPCDYPLSNRLKFAGAVTNVAAGPTITREPDITLSPCVFSPAGDSQYCGTGASGYTYQFEWFSSTAQWAMNSNNPWYSGRLITPFAQGTCSPFGVPFSSFFFGVGTVAMGTVTEATPVP